MAIAAESPKINDKREIFGWAMYDWANSAFSTTIGTVFLGPYLASLAQNAAAASPDKMAHLLGIPIAPDSFFPYCISFSVGMNEKTHVRIAEFFSLNNLIERRYWKI